MSNWIHFDSWILSHRYILDSWICRIGISLIHACFASVSLSSIHMHLSQRNNLDSWIFRIGTSLIHAYFASVSILWSISIISHRYILYLWICRIGLSLIHGFVCLIGISLIHEFVALINPWFMKISDRNILDPCVFRINRSDPCIFSHRYVLDSW